MARELISKEEAKKKIEERIKWYYDNCDMTVENNIMHLNLEIGSIMFQTKTDEEIDDWIKKNIHKNPNKRKGL